ncbi:hypothetical protein UCRPA7_5758 [Phaeoacremonium minimum UCRPA7]|uniref:Clr5 domain-containing protein n=1 Tax=Phaeoacremonium minimum (strain UCR-PA7) TaxID=1286976 RepID=R8BHC2_PHAM7|nr:hypothetical protein UCRPA7_5758 [Phaeoacremonium minimum UCRPA7]EON98713.1 hypothetical protein UCRPA7_5758 [Phaeoacremonium minimum UCRPA7]
MAHDWKLFEQDVIRLYVDGNQTESKTREYLQETYGLRVTSKQFKSKFGGLKNLRVDEWKAVIKTLGSTLMDNTE